MQALVPGGNKPPKNGTRKKSIAVVRRITQWQNHNFAFTHTGSGQEEIWGKEKKTGNMLTGADVTFYITF